jgi:hypothetical protein
MALGSTEPLTEISNKNILGGKGDLRVRLTSPPSVNRFCRKYWNLDASESHGLPQPVTGIALFFFLSSVYIQTYEI